MRGHYVNGHYGRRDSVAVSGFVDRLKLEALTSAYADTYQTLADQTKGHPDWAGWFTVAVEPVWKTWLAFRQTAGASVDAAAYQTWRHKLDVIQAGAKSIGLKTPMHLATIGLVGGGAVLLLGIFALATRRGS